LLCLLACSTFDVESSAVAAVLCSFVVLPFIGEESYVYKLGSVAQPGLIAARYVNGLITSAIKH